MDRNRAIQIGDDQGLLGSGYLIGPGLVLTALHVPLKTSRFKPEEAVPPSVTVSIRKLGDLQPDGGSGRAADQNWYPAELLWPASGSLKKFDMAILKVAAGAPAGYFDCPPEPLLPLVQPAGDEESKITCRGLGFPGWREKEGRSESSYLAHTADGSLDIPDWQAHPNDFSYTINSEAPPHAEDWKGISGTALFAPSGQIIAVLRANEASKNHRFFTATLVPDYGSADRADPDGFWHAVGGLAQGQRMAALYTHLRSGRGRRSNRAIEYMHILNRHDHDGKIRKGFRKRSDTRPAVVLFHSRERDAPPSYPKRYASGDHTLRLFGNRIQSLVPELHWPYHLISSDESDEAIRQLKDQLVELIPAASGLASTSSTAQLTSDDPAVRFQQYFNSERIPRALQILLRANRLQEVHYEMLTDFLEFFADAALSPELVCLFIGIIYEPDPGRESDFVTLLHDAKPCSVVAGETWKKIGEHLAPLFSRIHVWDAGALTQISAGDIDSWSTTLEQKSVRPTPEFFSSLTRKLAGGSRPLIEVTEIVAELGGGAG